MTAAATARGEIMGTAAYMAPEQASGKPVDKRADIWAFGVCLLEALTGRAVFKGEDAANTLAAVLRDPVDLSELPGGSSRSLERLLERCLVRDPRQRLRDIGDARIELQRALETTAEAPSETSDTSHENRPSDRAVIRRSTAAVLLVAAALVSATAAWWVQRARSAGTPPEVTRFSFREPGGALNVTPLRWVALSPDGRTVALIVLRGGRTQLYTRALDQLEARPVAGTKGANDVWAFSSDGTKILFQVEGAPPLTKMVDAVGGPATTVGALGFGVEFGPGDTILRGSQDGLRVGAAGSVPQVLTGSGRVATNPHYVPGEELVFFTTGAGEDAAIAAYSFRTREQKILVESASKPSFVRSGHLLFQRDGSLWATRFDLGTLSLGGEPVRLAESVEVRNAVGVNYQLRAGTLVYVVHRPEAGADSLVWVDRDGVERPTGAPERSYLYPRLSPSGTEVAVRAENDLWSYSLDRRTQSRLTFDPGQEYYSVWTPDGRDILFASDRSGSFLLYRARADGSGGSEPLPVGGSTSEGVYPSSISPRGDLLVFRTGGTSDLDLWVAPFDDLGSARRLVESADNELQAAVSPDGRWLAYASDETGRREVYVRPFPGDGGRWQISTEGGESPTWSRDTPELFYRVRGFPSRMMAVSYEADDAGFRPGAPSLLFEGLHSFGTTGRNYDVTADGQSFLMVKSTISEDDPPGEIVVVLHFDEELKRLLPVD